MIKFAFRKGSDANQLKKFSVGNRENFKKKSQSGKMVTSKLVGSSEFVICVAPRSLSGDRTIKTNIQKYNCE